MIGYLRGTLRESNAGWIILETGGIGFRVHLSERARLTLPPIGKEVELKITTIVREDAFDLYGFTSEASQRMFDLLMSVSGIGPKQANHILSLTPSKQIAHAIAEQNVDFLKSLKGIGKKTAEKIILELKGKVADLIDDDVEFSTPRDGVFEDVISALSQFGYRRPQVEEAMRKANVADDTNVEQAIKNTLKVLGASNLGLSR